MAAMKLTSEAFEDNRSIPKQYTCQGEDVSPPLRIAGVPEGSKSLALLVHDHDAPSGDFVHWIIWNINPQTIEKIEQGTTPIDSVEGTTDFNRIGYGGPCPPSGIHRYEFHLYALDSVLDLPAGSDKAFFREAIKDKIIEECSLTGLYEKV
jgi:Raf kinase inhibitor-like YbhB/YbcL family protein